jgi:hypothetical protein
MSTLEENPDRAIAAKAFSILIGRGARQGNVRLGRFVR